MHHLDSQKIISQTYERCYCLIFCRAEWYENTVDFVDGLEAMCGTGDPSIKEGLCIYTYLANKDMTGRCVTSLNLLAVVTSVCNVEGDVVRDVG